eukprot:sb/3462648/
MFGKKTQFIVGCVSAAAAAGAILYWKWIKDMTSTNTTEEQLRILSELLAEADTPVKEVLKAYDPKLTYEEMLPKIETLPVSDLEATAAFLGQEATCVSGQKKYSSERTLSDWIIMRTEALFPQTCRECSESYTVKRTDTPPVRCNYCDAGLHDCAAILAEAGDKTKTRSRIWMCNDCVSKHTLERFNSHLPDGGPPNPTLNSTRRSSNREQVLGGQPSDQSGSGRNNNQPGGRGNNTPTGEGTGPGTEVCKYYLQRRCRYGRSGTTRVGNRTCPKAHPLLCKKYCNYKNKDNHIGGLTEAMKIGIEMTQFAPKFDTFDPENTKINTGVIQMIQVVRVFHQHASDTGRPVLVGRLSEVRKNYKCHIPEHPLSFNPKQFSLKEYQYRMEPEARRILQLPWANRTDEEVHRVWLALRFLREFRNMTQLMQVTMARYARYEKHEKNRTIVRKGDPGRHYYFIYSGSVELRNSTVETHENYPKLTAGKDFGHVALLHMARRTASIVCVEDTEFVVMDRRGNGRAVYRALLLEHKRKKSFLKSMDVFNGVEDAEMTLLTDHTRINEYLPMTLIGTAEHGHPWVYIVMECKTWMAREELTRASKKYKLSSKVRFKRLDLRFLEIGVYCMLYLLKEILNFQESQVKSFETHFTLHNINTTWKGYQVDPNGLRTSIGAQVDMRCRSLARFQLLLYKDM